MTQAPNRYAVVMDAPLAPVDQRGLARFLQEQGASPGTPSAEIETALGHLTGLQLADLLELLEEYAARFRLPPGWDEHTFCPTVAEVVLALGVQMSGGDEDGERARFLELCSRVQQALVGQTYLGTQYFLRQWVPLLGHKLALVVVQLRSRCFWSEDTLRDEVSIGTKALAAASGCTPGWLRRAFKEPRTVKFFQVVSGGRGRRPTFRVTMCEPITPRNEAERRALLNAGVVIPESGQLGLPEPATVNASGERLGTPTNAPGEHHISTIVISTDSDRALKKQKHTGDPATAAALLLEGFGVGPPNDEGIVARSPDPDDVRAWMLYTLTQPGLHDPEVARGYVVNRLLAGEQPPTRFQRWARLTPDRWQALWRAEHYGGPYRATLPPNLAEAFDVWVEDFGGVFPAGPFGDGLVAEEGLRSALTALEDPPDGGSFDVVIRGDTIWFVPDTSKVARWLRDWVAWIRQAWARMGVLHEVGIAPADESEPSPSVDPGDGLTAAHVWQAALGELQLQMTQAAFDTRLRDSRLLECEDGTFVVGVKSEYARDWLEHRLLATIERTLARLTGRSVEVKFVAL